MPISDYDGHTFVAFLDISGFKQLMQNKDKALNALDKFYECGYVTLSSQNNRVEGIFISDNGVLFVRGNDRISSGSAESLKSLLLVIKRINEKMRAHNFMLTTSIAYGEFRYQVRREFEWISKTPVYGNAYVSAFLDNENEKPKIQPGQCRIVEAHLPNAISSTIEQNLNDEIFRMIKKREGDNKHYYYYWMVANPNGIKRFEQDYKDAYNLKYAGMLQALRGIRH